MIIASCFSAAFADSSNTPPAMPGNGDTSMSQPGPSQSLQTLAGNSIISQENVAISNEDSEGVLLSVCDDGWNGAENNAELFATSQQLEGCILVSSNSKFSLTLTGGSGFVVRSTETDNTLFQKGEWDGSCLCMLNSAINIDSIQEVLLTVGTEAFTLAAD